MPRKKGTLNKFQYAEPQVFKYQTFDRDTRDCLAYHTNPIFPSERILWADRFTNSKPQSEGSVAPHETESAPLERRQTDEGMLTIYSTVRKCLLTRMSGYVSSNDLTSPTPSKAALAPVVSSVAEEQNDGTESK